MRQLTLFFSCIFVFVCLTVTAYSGGSPSAEKPATNLKNITLEKAASPAPQTHEYFVLRNDKQIGFYEFTVRTPEQAEGVEAEGNEDIERDVLEVETRMAININVFFVTAYEADYSATSAYRGAKLLRHESEANYNGKNYLVTYDNAQNPDNLVVNSMVRNIIYPPMTLHPFYMQPNAEKVTFITEKGKLHNINYKTIGNEEIKIGARYYPTTHALITGDIEREMWYDRDGVLIKVSYEKDGATINLIRKGLSGNK